MSEQTPDTDTYTQRVDAEPSDVADSDLEAAQAAHDDASSPEPSQGESVQGIPGGSTTSPTLQEVGGQPAHLAQTEATQKGYHGTLPDDRPDQTLQGVVQAAQDAGTSKAHQDANLQS